MSFNDYNDANSDGQNVSIVDAVDSSLKVTVDASGNLKVLSSQNGTWNIGTLTSITNTVSVAGNVASGSADSGNPVKIAGKYNSALPTLSDGQRGDLQVDVNGRVILAPLTNTSIVKAQLQDNSGSAITLGQKTMANSIPVVISSDQSSLNINNISGTISLPTGAATAANQSTQLTSLQLIDDIPHSQNAALSKGVPFMGQLDDTSTTVATEDNVAVTRITAQRALHTNLRNSSGTEIGTATNPLYTNANSSILSPLPSVKLTKRTVLAAGASTNTQQTMSAATAIKELHIGGRAACEGFVAKYVAATTEQIQNGGFNSSGDVSAWTNTGIGSSAGLTWAYATDQFVEGTGSAKVTFTQSDNNNYPELTYTYSSPKDMSGWKQISARVRVTVAAGGSQTRTVQVRLTSGTAIRIYSITGTTTTAPFSTEQWHTILGDLDTPSSTAGTGTFDINNVTSVSLRLLDGGNKSGSIWWDDIKLVGSLTIIDKIYTAGDTRQLIFDPVIVFSIGEVLYISLTNTSASSTEFQISTSGVNA